MKKKIALLLTVVMSLSAGVSNAFAAGSVTQNQQTSTVVTYEKASDTPITPDNIEKACIKYAETYDLDMTAFNDYKGDNKLSLYEGYSLLNKLFSNLPEAKGFNLYSKPEYNTSRYFGLDELAKAGLLPEIATTPLASKIYMTQGDLDEFFENIHRYMGANVKDDYFATENKSYLDSIILDEEKDEYEKSVPSDVQKQNEENYDKLLDEIIKGNHKEGTMERQIQDFYKSLIDMKGRNERGVKPIQKYLDGIDKSANLNELLTFLKDNCNIYNYPLVGFGYDVDLNDSTKSTIYLSPCVDEAVAYNYAGNSTSISNQKLLESYISYFTDAGEDEETAKKDAKNFDTIARQISQAIIRDSNNSFDDYMNGNKVNQVKLSEIQKYYKTLNLTELCKAFGFNVTDENCCTLNFEATKTWGAYLDNSRIDQLKALAKFNIIYIYSEVLNKDVYYGHNATVTNDEIAEDAKNIVKHYMGNYLDKLYSDKYISEKTKTEVKSIANDVVDVYKNRINNLDWLSDSSKAKAIKKLDNMVITVGNPDWSEVLVDFKLPTLQNGGNAFTYLDTMYSVLSSTEAAKMNKPHSRIYWETGSVTSCNAEYVRRTNSINIYPGIMQEPIYSSSYSREKNLGTVGFIIAHEISHSFDADGAEYDENGNNKPWWSDSEKKTFEQKCQKAVELYEGKLMATNLYTSGYKTENENVADISAMSCVLDIIKGIDNADYKAFFSSFSSFFAGGATRDYLEKLNAVDSHSNYGARVNTLLSNVQEFYDTYGITENDAMYVKPENRITIW